MGYENYPGFHRNSVEWVWVFVGWLFYYLRHKIVYNFNAILLFVISYCSVVHSLSKQDIAWNECFDQKYNLLKCIKTENSDFANELFEYKLILVIKKVCILF